MGDQANDYLHSLMELQTFSWSLFDRMPVVGILRNIHPDTVYRLVPAYQAAGLTTLEITMNTPGAASIIETLSRQYNGRLNIGAGTVRNTSDLEAALKAGAGFIVTPVLDEQVIKECVKLGIPVFPGAYTPTEIYRAWHLGAPVVKVFPATSLGAGYFKDVLAPLNDIKLMPTGGVSLDTIPGFHKAGAVAYGIGGPLFDKELIRKEDWEGLERHFRKFSTLVSELRAE